MNRCKNCKYFKRYEEIYDNKNYGRCKCNKFVYGETTLNNEVYDIDKNRKKQDTDLFLYKDAEEYNVTIEVGENFGCIHFKEGKMTKADKMFEELGYVKKEISGMISRKIAYVDSGNDDIEIVFHLNCQLVYTKNYEGITMRELKAINEKCKELGWLDE